jgi:hypothetical protein
MLHESKRQPARTENRAVSGWWPALPCAAVVAFAAQSVLADVKVRVNFDKSFDFKTVKTWVWSEKAGDVMVARTPTDNAEDIKQLAEPVIRQAVGAEFPRHGLQPASGAADVKLTYYLLLTVGSSAQIAGQFLPAVTDWGVPPFTPSTNSLEVIEQGSLVLDLTANDHVVWRGIGEAKIKMGLEQDKRVALIHEAVREIMKKYPPRK